MAHYFKYFPTTEYDIDKSNSNLLLTDVTKRFTIKDTLTNRGAIYYKYQVKDSDRPDIVAEKLYGDGTLDWIILLINDIVDPYYDWPLTQSNLEKFIAKKYGSVSTAQANTHHYERILSKLTRHSDGSIIPERAVEVDLTTYNSLGSANRRLVTNYDFEVNENEKKRNIILLEKKFVRLVVGLYKEVLR